MDIQEEINSELLRLGVPHTSLGAFQLDASKDPKVVRADCEGVTGTFDPQDLLSLLQRLPDNAGSTVVTEALRTRRIVVRDRASGFAWQLILFLDSPPWDLLWTRF